MGYLGLELSAEPVAIDAGLGVAQTGAFIANLDPQSPSVAAGLAPGDVITALNGGPFRTPRELLNLIQALTPGSKANVTVLRNGQLIEIPVTIGQRPDVR
jgi:S1-C subfamily serine protease